MWDLFSSLSQGINTGPDQEDYTKNGNKIINIKQ